MIACTTVTNCSTVASGDFAGKTCIGQDHTCVLYTSLPSKRVVNSSLTRSHVVAVDKFEAVVQTLFDARTTRCSSCRKVCATICACSVLFCSLCPTPKLQIARVLSSFRICLDSLFYIHPFLFPQFWCNISKRHAIQSAPVKGLLQERGRIKSGGVGRHCILHDERISFPLHSQWVALYRSSCI